MANDWSDCGQIFFYSDGAFGLDENLRTVYLGDKDAINQILQSGELNDKLNTIQRQVMVDILEYRKEQSGEDIGAGGLERTRPMRITGRKQKAIRQFKARKGLPLHPIRAKD